MSRLTNESSEDYLETILLLSKKLPVVRAVDIANEMGFKKSSVSIAMKNLRLKDEITVTEAGYINFTEAGLKHAENIYGRHMFLKNMLEEMGVPSDIAEDDACRLEHVLSQESFDAIKRMFNQITTTEKG